METIVRKLPKLTKKQEGFINDYVLDENGTRAALNNYEIESLHDPENVAAAISAENLRKPQIIAAIEIKKSTLRSALENVVTPEKIAEKINTLLDAKRVTRTYIKGDMVTNVVEEDHNAIDKGLKHATNIYGIEDLEEKPKSNTTYNFIFSAETQEEIKEIENKIKQRLIQSNV